MHYESRTPNLERYRDQFPGPQLDLAIDSILEGNTAGELWEISTGSGTSILILWDQGNNVLYFTGQSTDGATLEAAAHLVNQEIRPRAIATKRSHFKTHALTPWVEAKLPHVFAGIELRDTETLFFAFDASTEVPQSRVDVPNLRLQPITTELLALGCFAYSEYVLAEINGMWSSPDRFFRQGFGTAAVIEREIIGWCTAEYVGPTHCGIGIETSPRFEGRGIATAMGAHFLRQARKRGLVACWECARSNAGSARVADKLGFRLVSEEMFWRGSF